ncbi:copper chaperone PCu(A)C [Lacimicrobium sp. SS2-24]|uniref:copper chaperone PCu(A)C n=1 Tax=Lacimicrobium sp. SS2-24 TaxID=2005569 RepID=UPI00143C9A08|nr:copper chaperone PCu(A)C [Lacimicrobium sp. SS2-24]
MRGLLSLFLLLPAICLAHVEIKDPVVRLLPPGVPNTAAYMQLVNTSSQDMQLVGASSESVERVEIHNHMMHEGMMKMVRQDQVTLSGNTTLAFKPGGLHLMMFGLKKPLQKGQNVTIRLLFSDDTELTFQAPVAEPQASSHHHH